MHPLLCCVHTLICCVIKHDNIIKDEHNRIIIVIIRQLRGSILFTIEYSSLRTVDTGVIAEPKIHLDKAVDIVTSSRLFIFFIHFLFTLAVQLTIWRAAIVFDLTICLRIRNKGQGLYFYYLFD